MFSVHLSVILQLLFFPHQDVSRSWRLLRRPGSGVALLNVSQRCQLTAEAPQEGAEMEQKLPSDFNHTTQNISTPSPDAGSGVYSALVPFVLLTLLGCVVAVVRGTAPLHCTGSGSQTGSQNCPASLSGSVHQEEVEVRFCFELGRQIHLVDSWQNVCAWFDNYYYYCYYHCYF